MTSTKVIRIPIEYSFETSKLSNIYKAYILKMEKRKHKFINGVQVIGNTKTNNTISFNIQRLVSPIIKQIFKIQNVDYTENLQLLNDKSMKTYAEMQIPIVNALCKMTINFKEQRNSVRSSGNIIFIVNPWVYTLRAPIIQAVKKQFIKERLLEFQLLDEIF